MDMKEREIQYCNPEELIPYEKNPRDNRAALDAIELSIEEYGFTNPILVNEEKVILAGHTRREAAILAGLEKVPYIVVDGLTEAQQKAYRLADNKLSELSIWDEDLLKEELEDLLDEDYDICCTDTGNQVGAYKSRQKFVYTTLKSKVNSNVKEETKMGVTAQQIIDIMDSWVGLSRAKGTHKPIIDLYNSHKPLARGYAVTYTDNYCDATVSAAFIKAGAVDLIGGTECGVEEHVKLFKKAGIWIEDGTITPEKGDIIVFNWDDATQPNDGYSDHIEVVRSVGSKNFETTGGNMNGGIVGHRTVAIGWGYIRGFARPKYAKANSSTPKPEKTDTGANTKPTGATTTTKTYTVKSGDNLTKIANKVGTTVQEIKGSKVQSIKNEKRGRNCGKSIFSGKIYCAKCGAKYWRSLENGYVKFKCSSYSKYGKIPGKGCDNKSFSENALYSILQSLSEQIVEVNTAEVRKSLLNWLESLRERLRASQGDDTIKEEIRKQTARKEKLTDAYMDGIISKEDYSKRYKELEKTLEDLKDKLLTLEVNEDLQSIEEVIQNIDKEMEEYLQTQSFNESRVEFLNQHLTKVTVNKDSFLLEFDLIGGAILTGKDFYLFVDNPRKYDKSKTE